MDEGVTLALTQMWWSWHTREIRQALAAALLDHWLPQAQKAMQKNLKAGSRHGHWNDVTALQRNPRNIRRVIQGQSAATGGFLLGIAAVLRLEVQMLYPTTREWVAGAAGRLCRRNLAEGDGRAYAAFVLERPSPDKACSEKELQRRLEAVSPESRAAVLRVARALGASLQRADKKVRAWEGEA